MSFTLSPALEWAPAGWTQVGGEAAGLRRTLGATCGLSLHLCPVLGAVQGGSWGLPKCDELQGLIPEGMEE